MYTNALRVPEYFSTGPDLPPGNAGTLPVLSGNYPREQRLDCDGNAADIDVERPADYREFVK
jgi:hypothetical protein